MIIGVLAAAATLVVLGSCCGLLLARDPLVRLHFLTPVTSLAAPLLGLALALEQGWTLAAGELLATFALLAACGPALTTELGRLLAGRSPAAGAGPASGPGGGPSPAGTKGSG